MQISNYYRDSSGKEMHKILEEWTELLFKIDDPVVQRKSSDVENLKQLLNDTYLYPSPETCKRLARYQQYTYTKLGTEEHDSFVTVILVAGIITSLKHDFTGEWIGIEETLKIKLNDYEENKDKIRELIKKSGYKLIK